MARKRTSNQRDQPARVAEKRRCPKCGRGAALSSPYELLGGLYGTIPVGHARECRYCGHEVGIRDRVPFGHKGQIGGPS